MLWEMERWGRLSPAMLVATTSATSLGIAVIALIVRGADDWSGAFAAFWWIFAGSAVCWAWPA